MTDQPKNPLGPQEEILRKAIRDLPRVEADAAFRERLMRDFVAGTIEAPAGAEAIEESPAPGPAKASPEAGSRVVPLPPRPSIFSTLSRWVALPAAAAVLLVALHTLNRGPGWTMSWVTPPGTVTLDNRPFEPGELAGALAPGRVLATDPAVGMEFEIADLLAFEVTPDTEMLIPSAPGRWWGRTVECRVERGEARFSTGSKFPGHRLVVSTPEGLVEVTGTVISVYRDDSGTCICVMNGVARVGPSPDRLDPVETGKRMVIPADGEPYITDIAPPHLEGMIEFDERHPHR